jgi:hypothetical protein
VISGEVALFGTRVLITENIYSLKTKTNIKPRKTLYDGEEINCVGPEQIKMGSYQSREESIRTRYVYVCRKVSARQTT